MTYRGRPSYGCQTCRRRKKKCDCSQPTCKNCAKSGWKCPGYPNSLDLLFRDESAKVAEKAKAAQQEPRVPKCERAVLDQSRTKEDDVTRPRTPRNGDLKIATWRNDLTHGSSDMVCPGATICLDLDELAFAYFFHYYVLQDESVSESWRAAEGDSCLSASILAVGAAGVTKSGPGLSCSPGAQVRYLEAIRLTNGALQSPTDVKKDSVLLAVNLLASFEIITGLQRTFEAWHNHVEGAAALLQYRGIEQFETAEGGRLFMGTAISLATSCIGRRSRIPAYIHQLAAKADQFMPLPKDKKWLFFGLTLRFADLYGRCLPNNILPSTENAASFFREALTLDQDMAALLSNFSEDWYFETVLADDPTSFNGVIHVYPHFTVAQQHNSMRWKRIILHDMMLKVLRARPEPASLGLSVDDVDYIGRATQIIRRLQLDILASVPQHLSTSFPEFNFFSPISTTSPDGVPRDRMWTNFACKDANPWRRMKRQQPSLPLVRMSCTDPIQWSLYIAGAADSADGEVRSWTVKMLRRLGRDMGLQHAMLLAKSLELYQGEQLDAHLTLCSS